MNINDVLVGHSKAMYSTWFLYRPDNLLFDCGEGCALTLNTRVFGVDTIFLTHGHLDHIMGLPGFFFARTAAKGDKTKPLRIVHPPGDKDIPRLRDYIDGSFKGNHALKFPLSWVEAELGQLYSVGSNRWVRCFKTRHDPERTTFGYELVEERKKLKEEFRGRNDIRFLIDGGVDVFDYQPRRVLIYTGDTTVQDLAVFEGAELAIHEATFVNAEDVKYDSHSLVDDVLKVMANRKPKELLLMHFSTRYSPSMCGAAVRTKAKELSLMFPVWIQFGEYLWKAFDPQDMGDDEPKQDLPVVQPDQSVV